MCGSKGGARGHQAHPPPQDPWIPKLSLHFERKKKRRGGRR